MNQFPALPGQTFVVNKGPSWTTTVKKAASGRQVRNSLQAAPIWKFKIAYEFLRDRSPSASELQNLLSFFNSALGQFEPWLFLDPFDNLVLNEPIGVGDGATTSFQLVRTLGASFSTPFIEPVYATPASNAPTIQVGGSPSTAWALEPFGVIQFTPAPPAGQVITWSGQFCFLCHFTQDDLQPSQMVKDMWTSDGLEFESLVP